MSRMMLTFCQPLTKCLFIYLVTIKGKTMESVHCTISGPCLRMCHRPSACRLQHVTAPIRDIYPTKICSYRSAGILVLGLVIKAKSLEWVCLNHCNKEKSNASKLERNTVLTAKIMPNKQLLSF